MNIEIVNGDLVITEQKQLSGSKDIKDGDTFDMEYYISVIPLKVEHSNLEKGG
jgi:hypothetical protein